MNQEIIEFWKRNHTPIGRMIQNADYHRVKPADIEKAAEIIYYEILEVLENVPDVKWHMTRRSHETLMSTYNQLRPIYLGQNVYTVAKQVAGNGYTTALEDALGKIEDLEAKLEKRTLRYKWNKWLHTGKWR